MFCRHACLACIAGMHQQINDRSLQLKTGPTTRSPGKVLPRARLTGAVLCLLLLSSPAQSQDDPPTPQDLPATNGFTFDCTGDSVAAIRFLGPETVELAFRGGQYILPRERAASGARYSTREVTFWNKGDSAMIEVNGVKYNCLRNG